MLDDLKSFILIMVASCDLFWVWLVGGEFKENKFTTNILINIAVFKYIR